MYKVLSDETKNAKENYPMYKSILEFIEKGTTKIEKITKAKIEMFNSTLPLCSGILLCTSGI